MGDPVTEVAGEAKPQQTLVSHPRKSPAGPEQILGTEETVTKPFPPTAIVSLGHTGSSEILHAKFVGIPVLFITEKQTPIKKGRRRQHPLVCARKIGPDKPWTLCAPVIHDAVHLSLNQRPHVLLKVLRDAVFHDGESVHDGAHPVPRCQPVAVSAWRQLPVGVISSPTRTLQRRPGLYLAKLPDNEISEVFVFRQSRGQSDRYHPGIEAPVGGAVMHGQGEDFSIVSGILVSAVTFTFRDVFEFELSCDNRLLGCGAELTPEFLEEIAGQAIFLREFQDFLPGEPRKSQLAFPCGKFHVGCFLARWRSAPCSLV